MSDWKDVLPKRVEEEIELKKDKDINYNQKTLCQNVGISEATLSLLLKGERNPRIDTIIALAKEFDVDVDYLIGTTDFKKRPSSEKEIEMEQLCKMFGLNEKSIQNLLHSDLGVNYKDDNAAETLDAIFGKGYFYNQLMWKLQNYFMNDDVALGGAYVINGSVVKEMKEEWDEDSPEDDSSGNRIKIEVDGEVDDFYDNCNGMSHLTHEQYDDLLLQDVIKTIKDMKKFSTFEIYHLENRIETIRNQIEETKKYIEKQKKNPSESRFVGTSETMIDNYNEEIKELRGRIKALNDANKQMNWPED